MHFVQYLVLAIILGYLITNTYKIRTVFKNGYEEEDKIRGSNDNGIKSVDVYPDHNQKSSNLCNHLLKYGSMYPVQPPYVDYGEYDGCDSDVVIFNSAP